MDGQVMHFAQAYFHCRTAVIRLRAELVDATDLALTKEQQRALLARELAAANQKVRVLAAAVEDLQLQLDVSRTAFARMRSECSEVGL